MKKEGGEEGNGISLVLNSVILLSIILFVVAISPLKNASLEGYAIKQPSVKISYNTQNIAVDDSPARIGISGGCYDSDAPTGLETLKAQIYTEGLVETGEGISRDRCISELNVEENTCLGSKNEKKVAECPKGMLCKEGKCS